ncbi:hypothetical protein PG993_010833 [Apiospora rasikravindrae]|uniref:Uncharacterized protein n=1 Tax=Apiospora rasikravindrae TaxID=990691 RepID=A0ABR1SCH7_9PEZI
MRFLTVAALAAGGAASAIPAASNPFLPAAKNSIHRRITRLVTLIPPQTCSSYTTLTVTPPVLTVTRTEDVTVTAETVTSTRVSVKQSTQETTDIATITAFETSFVTATVTAATVTKTTVAQQPLRKKKRGDSCKRHLSSSSSSAAAAQTTSSSSSSASDDISVAPSTSTSSDAVTSTSPSIIPSGPVCTVTVSAAALNTIVTVTATGSATATAIETVTSLIVATVTTTVHTTDLKTTAVPTTLAVTATTTTIAPAATPTFFLRASGGDVDSKYLVMVPSFEPSFSYIDYTTASNAATKFHLDAAGALVPAGAPAGSVAHFSDADGIASYVLVTDKAFAEPMSGKPTQCRLQAGATAVGATGAFTCPDDGALKVFSNIDGHLNVQSGSEPGTVFTLKYTVVS